MSNRQFKVYVAVDTNSARDNSTEGVSKMPSGITNYEYHANYGNLLTLDINSFYNSDLAGNVQPVEEQRYYLSGQLKSEVHQEIVMKE